MDVFSATERSNVHQMPLDRRKSASTVDGEHGDTCRICRGEGTLDQPLFYPCKCSGSIKFVHQDCLMEWLAHSQKKYCELCKTPFRFTKLYDKSMPATLPLPLFVRQVAVHAIRTFGRWVRYVFVTFIWTCWLPWSIRQIWRGLFWLADGSWMTAQELKELASVDVAAAIVDSLHNTTSSLASPPIETLQPVLSSRFDPVGDFFSLFTGAPLLKGLLRLLASKSATVQPPVADTDVASNRSLLLSSSTRQPSLLSNVSSLNALTKYPVVNNGLIDILEGQLVCLSIIAAFILVFLIREWVINQQPILNMPNPDQADAQPAPPPPNEEAHQQGRRRRRGFRRLPDQDGQAENPVLDIAQRPVAIPRTRRALTQENVVTNHSPGTVPERPDIPIRAASLVPQSSRMDNNLNAEFDDESSWHPQDSFRREGSGPPPLQRGMLDEVVDIRRNIEERMFTPEDSDDDSSDHGLETIIPVATVPLASSAEDNSDIGADQVQRTDFVTGPNTIFTDSNNSSNDNSTFSPLPDLSVQYTGHDSTDESLDTSNSGTQSSDSLWETLDVGQNEESVNDSDIEPTTDQQDVIEVGPRDNADTIIPENTSLDENIVPDTAFGLVTQWMWHTDEQTRVEAQVAEAAANEERIENANEGGHQRHIGNNAAVNPAQEPANPPAHDPNVQFGADLNDPNAADDAEDLEGILELIGMEGPLAGMIQNIIFSVFLITLTLSASVWCPYIWGKIAILVISNPIGVFVKAPLLFVSKCGNILIDLMMFVGSMTIYGLSNLAKVVKIVLASGLPNVAARIKVATVDHWSYSISQSSGTRLEKALAGTFFGLRPDLPTFSMQSHHALRILRHAFVEASSAVYADVLETFINALNAWNTWGLLGPLVFLFNEVVTFPEASFRAAQKVIAWWGVLADDLKMKPLSEISDREFALVEWTTEDKILATIVGYAFFAAAGFAYLKIAHAVLGLRKDEKVDGLLADSLRQAGGVLKVIVIIGIEMIVFPLYCGLLLDCALLPLFKDATFQSRLAFLLSTPVTCLFMHWFIGTCYMFHFALFVSMCRKTMRKGVLYFIRDPDDPTFHPVRDVLERPVATQLGKIAFSALVYGGLVILCLGGVVWTISSINGILPIHWATSEPRLAFPVDIVFYNFMLPFILKRAEPSKQISAMYEWWFQRCAKTLRLTHFLLGREQDDEKFESQPFWHHKSAEKSRIQAIVDEGQPEPTTQLSETRRRNGRYVRVPAADSVRIPKGVKVFVEVNEKNERIDGQPEHDKGLHGKKDDRFVRIYIPPHFKKRVAVFVFLVWVFSASTGVAFTVLPLLVGRQLIHFVASSTSPPNDLYAFTVGLHCCGAIAFGGYMGFTRKDKLHSKAVHAFTNTKESLPRFYEMLKRALGLMYLFTVTFIVLPFATSLLTELYIHMPIYNYFASSLAQLSSPTSASASASAPAISISPTIFILQTWTLGLLYLRLALRFAINYPNGQNRPSIALRAITRNGYLNPDIALASRALVLPALTICIVLLTAPLGFARITIVLTGTSTPAEKLQLYRYSYPFLLGLAASLYLVICIQNKIEGWRVKVRDEVYLVGERLHNFTDSDNAKGKKVTAKARVDSSKGKERAADIGTIIEGEASGSGNIVRSAQGNAEMIVGREFSASEDAVASGSSVG